MSQRDEIVTFFCPGVPVPQGSMSVGRQGQIFHSKSDKLKQWRNQVAAAARRALPDDYEPTDGACYLQAVFAYDKPRSRPRDEAYKPTMPDADKLLRAVFDALTGIVYTDDCRVADAHAQKVYVGMLPGADEAGVTVRVSRL